MKRGFVSAAMLQKKQSDFAELSPRNDQQSLRLYRDQRVKLSPKKKKKLHDPFVLIWSWGQWFTATSC